MCVSDCVLWTFGEDEVQCARAAGVSRDLQQQKGGSHISMFNQALFYKSNAFNAEINVLVS